MLKNPEFRADFEAVKAEVRKGLGLMNIKNRAELFGGHLEIVSKPGQGCLLKVSFPYPMPQLLYS